MPKVLIICTSADTYIDKEGKPVLDKNGKPEQTGCWVEEVAAPYYAFKGKGCDVTIVSINGGEIPFDEASLNPPFLTPEAEKFILDDEAMKQVTESTKLAEDTNGADFDIVFLPGGHGTCFDFPKNDLLAKVVSDAFRAGKVVSAVCHGPMGLVSATDASGAPIVAGRTVTGFSDKEEHAVVKEDLVPFLLETRLKELGGKYVSGENWAPHAVRDGNLVTGQNPASSARTAELALEAAGIA